jgi:hypothetical protein
LTPTRAPGHRAFVIAVGRELVGTRGSLLQRVLTVTLEHQSGGAPDVDLGYHAEKSASLNSQRGMALSSSCRRRITDAVLQLANTTPPRPVH